MQKERQSGSSTGDSLRDFWSQKSPNKRLPIPEP
jgi:hypothetical protein